MLLNGATTSLSKSLPGLASLCCHPCAHTPRSQSKGQIYSVFWMSLVCHMKVISLFDDLWIPSLVLCFISKTRSFSHFRPPQSCFLESECMHYEKLTMVFTQLLIASFSSFRILFIGFMNSYKSNIFFTEVFLLGSLSFNILPNEKWQVLYEKLVFI